MSPISKLAPVAAALLLTGGAAHTGAAQTPDRGASPRQMVVLLDGKSMDG